MYVITGSTAVNHHIPTFREGPDVDGFYLDEPPKILTLKHNDFSQLSSGLFEILYNNSTDNILSLNALYNLKLSHIFWDVNHQKTINDVIFFQNSGCTVDPSIFYPFKEYWSHIHGDKSFLNLKRTKDSFFDDYVRKRIDHDQIHELIAKYDRPLYTMCLAEGEEVLLDYHKFEQLSMEDQLHLIREEIIVIAIERFGIPKQFRWPSGICYRNSLSLTLTNLMKGEFGDFLAFNLNKIFNYKMTNEYFLMKTICKERGLI